MTEIIPGLWIGTIDDANSLPDNKRIRTVLNISALDITEKKTNICYFDIPIKKALNLNTMPEIFDVTNKIIDLHISGGIMVNCKQARHRSATVIVAYLMKKYHFTLKDAMFYVKDKHENAFTGNSKYLIRILGDCRHLFG